MINFVTVVTRILDTCCKEKYTVREIEKNIVEVAFNKFTIRLYYNAYEYDIGLKFCRNRRFVNVNYLDLEYVLLNLGCTEDQLPKYKFISNEEVAETLLEKYVVLINLYFKELSKYKCLKTNG